VPPLKKELARDWPTRIAEAVGGVEMLVDALEMVRVLVAEPS
jgi:hypothetical protein